MIPISVEKTFISILKVLYLIHAAKLAEKLKLRFIIIDRLDGNSI